MEIREATSENLEQFHHDLTTVHQADGIGPCPMNGPVYPTLVEAEVHLRDGHRLVGLYNGDDELTHTLLVVDGSIWTCYAAVDRDAMYESVWKFLDYFHERGEQWRLDPGWPGWVNRKFFEDFCLPLGPFDTTVHQPGLPEGTTYADHDDNAWTLTIASRDEWWVELRPER